MIKVLMIVMSSVLFSAFSWANGAFLIEGQSVGGEHPTKGLRVYWWQESFTKLKLEEQVELPSTGTRGIYELGMNHNKGLFAVVGGWSPALKKASMTVLKLQGVKVTKQSICLT